MPRGGGVSISAKQRAGRVRDRAARLAKRAGRKRGAGGKGKPVAKMTKKKKKY
tara:strand:- start:16 stop:174 length:159 start_codon:yes stop_codon:yes gene_type:complete